MEDLIECTKCGWQGLPAELVCRPEDGEKSVKDSRFDVCPECDVVGCFEDYED